MRRHLNSCALDPTGAHDLEAWCMANTQKRATKDVKDSVEGVEEAPAAVEGTATGAVERTTGALVGMLTGGIVIAAVAGFGAGVVVGVAIGRRPT